jgi:hypothetical protein
MCWAGGPERETTKSPEKIVCGGKGEVEGGSWIGTKTDTNKKTCAGERRDYKRCLSVCMLSFVGEGGRSIVVLRINGDKRRWTSGVGVSIFSAILWGLKLAPILSMGLGTQAI